MPSDEMVVELLAFPGDPSFQPTQSPYMRRSRLGSRRRDQMPSVLQRGAWRPAPWPGVLVHNQWKTEDRVRGLQLSEGR